jgi:hypothetical protein
MWLWTCHIIMCSCFFIPWFCFHVFKRQTLEVHLEEQEVWTVCTQKSSFLVPGHKGEERDDEDGIDQLASAGGSAAALFPGNTGIYVVVVG